jgi:hypothetical protein
MLIKDSLNSSQSLNSQAMETNDKTINVIGWLQDQVRSVNQAISDLEKSHNYGKAALCEGMRDAYMKCLEKLKT